LFLQGPFDLSSLHSLDGDRLDFLANPFLFQKAIDGRTRVSRSLAISFYSHYGSLDVYPFLASQLRKTWPEIKIPRRETTTWGSNYEATSNYGLVSGASN
jgi:hypothetical protein